MKLDIVIAGVGGQGSILASRAIAQAAIDNDLEVRTSEVIGMAQREGPVTSHIRIAEELFGAIIPDGQADILLGLELAETVRNLDKLKPDGIVITSSSAIVPVSVELGISSYPKESFIKYLKEKVKRPVFLDLESLSLQTGNSRSGNVVLLGSLSVIPNLPFSSAQLIHSVLSFLPEKFRDMNRQAFELGRKAMEVV